MPDWRKIGSALTSAEAVLPDNANAPADRWIEAIAGTLALDPLEARMLALALHYKLDQRVQRLFDAASECRGLITRFNRDSGLIALLLHVPAAEIEMRLTGDAKLRASGLLRVHQHGELCVLERLASLIRQDMPPSADFYDQLLGAITVDPLPWESFGISAGRPRSWPPCCRLRSPAGRAGLTSCSMVRPARGRRRSRERGSPR